MSQEGDEFQQMLLNMFQQMLGGDPNAMNSPEYQSFFNDFKEGFATGAAASQQYQQFTENVRESEKAGSSFVDPIIRFFFNNTTGLSWLICCKLIILPFMSSNIPFLQIAAQTSHLLHYPDHVHKSYRLFFLNCYSRTNCLPVQYPFIPFWRMS